MASTTACAPNSRLSSRDQFGTAHGGGVDGDLVGAGHQDAARIGDGADAAAHGERDEDLARGAGHYVRHDFAGIARGGDVEEDQFVGALLVVAIGQFDGIARIAQVDEVDAFDDAAGGDVETGNDAFGAASHIPFRSSTKLRTMARPSGPDFSGWHWTPNTLPDSRSAV